MNEPGTSTQAQTTNSPPKPMTVDEVVNAFGRVMIENDYLRKLVTYYRERLAELGVKED
jgi:hypothetical protein